MKTLVFENPVITEIKLYFKYTYVIAKNLFYSLLGDKEVINSVIKTDDDVPRNTVYSEKLARIGEPDIIVEDNTIVDRKTIQPLFVSNKEENDFYLHMEVLADDIKHLTLDMSRMDVMDKFRREKEIVKTYRKHILDNYGKVIETANVLMESHSKKYPSVLDRIYTDLGIAIWKDRHSKANFLKVNNIIVAI